MADSIIGALRVVLGLDTAAFSTGAKEAETSLAGLAKTFKSAIAGLSVGVIAEQFTSAIQKTIDAADAMGKASQKFGVPVEQLSALKYAADLADVSFESLEKGLGKLSKAILEGATDPAGKAAKNFQALGLSLKDGDGQLKTSGDVLLDVAEKFSTMADGSAKTALAIRLFGRAGADLIPLLNQGRDGIKATTDEAQRLGIVISTQTAINAEKFNDTMKTLHASTQAYLLEAVQPLLPRLQEIADLFTSTSNKGAGLRDFFANLITEGDIQQVQLLVQYWENFVRVLTALKEFPGNIVTQGLSAALDTLSKSVDINQQKLDTLKASFLSLGQAGAFDSIENLAAQIAKVGRGVTTLNEGALAAKNALDRFIESQAKAIANTQTQAATVGAAVGVQEAMRVTMEGQAIATAHNITMTDAQRVALKNLSDQTGAAAIALKGAQLTQEFLTPWDLYQQKLRDINIQLQQNAINADTAKKAGAKAASDLTQVYGDAAATAMGNFATFFTTFGKGNEEMFAIAKAFSISQAIINTYVAATKALSSLPPPLSYVAAAATVAAGLAMVATIIAQKPAAKAAAGGVMQIQGAGIIDSKMVPVMATPGERVSFDANKYGESTGSTKTVTLQGLKPKEYYRGDVLRDFVDNLNQAIGDGLKIKLA